VCRLTFLYTAGWVYVFYTVWNFILTIVYFGLGLGLSIYAEVKGPDAIKESRYWRINALIHYVVLEIEFPNALLYVRITLGF
jgi:hypothetical protein